MVRLKFLILLVVISLLFIVSNTFAKPLDNMKICVDPGHGGNDSGAVGPTGLKESDENLIISNILFGLLETDGGAKVFQTRKTDVSVSLPGRVKVAEDNDVYWFISIHLNAGEVGDHTTNYTSVLYYPGSTKGEDMARVVQEYLYQILSIPQRGSTPRGDLYVLEKTTMPADLSECAFISSTTEENLLKTTETREQNMAQGIYEGIVDYFTTPIVQKVSIIQEGKTRYEVYWQEDTTNRTLNKISDVPINAQSDASIVIEFDEKIKSVEVKVGNITIIGSLDSTKKKWTGILTQSSIQSLGNGEKVITISSKDFADNILDANPSTIAKYNFSTSQFDNYEDKYENPTSTHTGGIDTLHKFKIDIDTTAPTVVNYTPKGNNIPPPDQITATFSEPMDKESTEKAFSISASYGSAPSLRFYGWEDNKIIFDVTGVVAGKKGNPGPTYTVTISKEAKDKAGNSDGFTWSFSTWKDNDGDDDPDETDPDDDNDGIPDEKDPCPFNPDPDCRIIGVGGIYGKVTDAVSGGGIGGAFVEVLETGKSTTTEGTAPLIGAYGISGIPEGTYGVTAKKEGYYDSSETVYVEMGKNVEVNLELVPKLEKTEEITATDPTFISPPPVVLPVVVPEPLYFSFGTLSIPYFVFHKEVERTSTPTLNIFNSSGALIRSIKGPSAHLTGFYEDLIWDGKDTSGNIVSDGNYRYKVEIRDDLDNSNLRVETRGIIVDKITPTASIQRIEYKQGENNVIQIYGTAIDNYLKNYRIEYGPSTSSGGEEPSEWISIGDSPHSGTVPIIEGILAKWDTSSLASGTYTIKLTVEDKAGNVNSVTKEFIIPSETAGLRITGVSTTSEYISGAGEYMPDNAYVWIDDDVPEGSTMIGEWQWDNNVKYSGMRSHTNINTSGQNYHYFIKPKESLIVNKGDNIIQYVYIDPSNVPKQIMLQFYTDSGDGEHRIFFGNNSIQTTGTLGSISLYKLGELPFVGKWIRLKIPASLVGLEGVEDKVELSWNKVIGSNAGFNITGYDIYRSTVSGQQGSGLGFKCENIGKEDLNKIIDLESKN